MPYVRFRDCTCPETPHADPDPAWGDLSGDVAELRPYLDYAGGAEALSALASLDGDMGRMAEVLGPIFIRRGVVAWNVEDENGPVTPSREILDALRWEDAYELADRADDLYGGQVLAPLVKRQSMSSKAGQTGGSTPRRTRSSRTRLTPSGSSS